MFQTACNPLLLHGSAGWRPPQARCLCIHSLCAGLKLGRELTMSGGMTFEHEFSDVGSSGLKAGGMIVISIDIGVWTAEV